MSETAKDPIGQLAGLAVRKQAQDDAIRRAFTDLEVRLKTALNDESAWGQTENVTLAENGDGDAVYGHLYYSGTRLSVAHRTTDDDIMQAMSNDPSDPTYEMTLVAKCPVTWLVAISKASILEALFADIHQRLSEQVESTEAAARLVAGAVHIPIRDVDASLKTAAAALNYHDVIEQWMRAQAAVGVDPSDAATRACSLLESVLKHILGELHVHPPADQSVKSLLKVTMRVLDLSPDKQTAQHLLQIGSGVQTIVHGIGSLRTHTGTAHGRGPGSRGATAAEARLSVSISGSVATYLMSEVLKRRAK